MSIIDNAVQHYRELAGQRKCIEVPEWGQDGRPALIFAKPFVLAEEQAIERRCKDDAHERAVEILIMKCTNEQGEKIFTREHKMKLMKEVSSSVVCRIAKEIMGDSGQIIEDMEGN
tara:strand:+ start:652 stop:999 length:348 start_codon:yes stop_codon:yes gene_type:complete